jgi:hypothetical protein
VSSVWVRFRNVLSAILDPAEREAFCGDCMELAQTDRQVVQSLLGLIVRRQLTPWRAWNPWIAVAAFVIPVCSLLVSQSFELDSGIWQVMEMWLHHGVRYENGLTLAAQWTGFSLRAAALITWSWSAGFALRKVFRGTIWISAGLFFALYLGLGAATEPLFYGILWPTWLAWLPLLLSFPFVLVPACLGIRYSRSCRHMKLSWIALLGLWTMLMAALSLWTRVWISAAIDNWGRGEPALSLAQLARYSVVSKINISQVMMAVILPVLFASVLAKDAYLHAPRRNG